MSVTDYTLALDSFFAVVQQGRNNAPVIANKNPSMQSCGKAATAWG